MERGLPFYLDRPLNLAHAGASHEAPANTLAAFLLARELGADGVELDVHLSRDGELVVIHNYALDATTDGHGLVRDRTVAELKALDAGSWFDPVFAGESIPTLQEVVDALGPSLLINIELKTESLKDDGLASAAVELVEKNDLRDRVVISSFNPFALWRVRRLDASISVGMLYSDGLPFFLRRPWLRHLVRPEAMHPEWPLVDDDYLQWARARGLRVHTWTVNDPGRMWQLVQAGVDLIITDRPDVLCRVLEAARQPGGSAPRGRRGR
jgi:glycerophosphoryl diester phosphodiesterase